MDFKCIASSDDESQFLITRDKISIAKLAAENFKHLTGWTGGAHQDQVNDRSEDGAFFSLSFSFRL